MCIGHSSLDARFAQADASERLQSSLHLPRTHRDVADWLYSEGPQSQETATILSPETFNRSAATTTLTAQTNLAVNLSPSDKESPITAYSETFTYALYLPIKESNDIALGYSFHAGMPRRGSSCVTKDFFPSEKLNRGRYAYKKDAKLLICFIRVSASVDIIVYVRWMNGSQRLVQYFVVPHQQYSFHDQPSAVISVTCAAADNLCPTFVGEQTAPLRDAGTVESPSVDITAGPSECALPSGPSDYVDGVWRSDNISSLPQCMFQDLDTRTESTENRHYRESSSWLREHQVKALGGSETQGLVRFKTRTVRRARAMEGGDTPVSLLDGNFYSAYVVRDTFGAGRVQRLAFEGRTRATAAEPMCLELLRRAATQLYYSVVLWASTDQRLVAAQERSAAATLWKREE